MFNELVNSTYILDIPTYTNKAFVDAFGEAFTNFALSLNPNIKVDPTNITPQWDRWQGKFEMLFNKTEAGAPLIKEYVTSPALLERCRYVVGLLFFFPKNLMYTVKTVGESWCAFRSIRAMRMDRRRNPTTYGIYV